MEDRSIIFRRKTSLLRKFSQKRSRLSASNLEGEVRYHEHDTPHIPTILHRNGQVAWDPTKPGVHLALQGEGEEEVVEQLLWKFWKGAIERQTKKRKLFISLKTDLIISLLGLLSSHPNCWSSTPSLFCRSGSCSSLPDWAEGVGRSQDESVRSRTSKLDGDVLVNVDRIW